MKATDILPDTFIVADIETTGLDADRDEIIEIAAIKVSRDSDQHATLSALVRPSEPIPASITRITGITREMVDSDGEALDKVIHEFLDFFADHRLVFYNSPFDMGFLQNAAARVGRAINNPVSDALAMARQAYPDQGSYKLTSLAAVAGLSTSNAHRALVDCEMTLAVYSGAVAKLGRIDPRPAVKHGYPAAVKSAAGNPDGHLQGENAVFTGELSLPRDEMAAMAVKAGCGVAGGVSKKTTLLVVGDQDVSLLAGHNKSSKQRRAEEINQKLVDSGKPPAIKIISETEFFALITGS